MPSTAACLTVRLDVARSPSWLEQRRLALCAAPRAAGLLARWWRHAPRASVGRYVFSDQERLRAFVAAPRWDAPCAELDERATHAVQLSSAGAPAVEFDRPVFIVCAPRTGSTVLHEQLVRCRDVWSLDGELQPLIDGIAQLNIRDRGFDSQRLDERDADPATVPLLRQCLLADLRDASGRRLLDLAPEARPRSVRFVDKTPENSLRIPFLKRAFPDARFIYLHRDLRQNVSSLIEAWQHEGFISIPDLPGFSRRHWCFLLPAGWQRHQTASLTQLAGFQWHAANQAIVDDLEALPREDWTTVSYDELIAMPAQTLERLCTFMQTRDPERIGEVQRRGLPLSATTISPPSPIKWKSNRQFDAELTTALQPLAGRMRSLSVRTQSPVLRATHVTSVRFANFVDEIAVESAAPDDAIVAPTLHAQLGSAVPPALFQKVQHRERFLAEHPVLWVEDPAHELWCPLWLRTRQAWLCTQMRAGRTPPMALTGVLRDQLFAANVLTTPARLAERAAQGVDMCREGARDLEQDRYCVLRQLLQPVLARALARYYNALVACGDWPLGDEQVRRRHGWHNETVAQFMHLQLTAAMSRIACVPLKPTYAFASAYRGGASLSAHRDREQCDYTLSLMIDEVRPDSSAPWKLWFQAPGGQASVVLAVGDAVFFRGCEIAHWRDAASNDHSQINLLFHFVRADWRGVLD